MSTKAEIDALMGALQEMDDPEAVDPKVHKLVDLRGRAVQKAALLRLIENPDFKVWLDYHQHRDRMLLFKMIHSDVTDPFVRGQITGELRLILQLRAEGDRVRKDLAKISDELQKLQTPEPE